MSRPADTGQTTDNTCDFDGDGSDVLDDVFDELAEIETVEMTPIERLQARLDRLGLARERTLVMARALVDIAPYETKLIGKLQDCGASLIVHQFNSIGDVRLFNVRSCNNHLLCGVCAIRRSLRLLVPNLLKYQVIRKIYPDLVPLFITITIKNGNNLDERFNHLVDSLKTLKRRRIDSRRRSGYAGEFTKVSAWLGSYEVKRGIKLGLWHPHCHLLALVESNGLDEVELSYQWLATTRDSFMVDCRSFDCGKPAIKAFCEMFKHALKLNNLEPEDRWIAREVLSGRKMVFSAGLFRGNACPEANVYLNDNMKELINKRKSSSYSDMVYEFIEGSGYSLNPDKSRFERGFSHEYQ